MKIDNLQKAIDLSAELDLVSGALARHSQVIRICQVTPSISKDLDELKQRMDVELIAIISKRRAEIIEELEAL